MEECITEISIPESLKQIPQPPKKLYIRGIFPITEKYLCVIGGRKHSDYGVKACEELLKGLTGYSVTIVSGLALGIDTVAHKTAMKNNLPTIAFPGSGLQDRVIYPASHLSVARDIIESGCLLSEFEPSFKAQAWAFPQRNRLMAGISDAILILEAEQKSGTMITARMALDYNKSVLALPGSIFSKYSEGPHYLFHEGATPIRNVDDILEALGLEKKTGTINPKYREEIFNDLQQTCSPVEARVLSTLLNSPLSRNELVEEINLPIYDINIALTLLELKDAIEEKVGIISLKI